MEKIKTFFKNLKTEYLLISKTRNTCPTVIKFEKICSYIWTILIVLTFIVGVGISASAEEPTTTEPRAVTLNSGEYTLNYQGTIPSSLGYFQLDILFTDLAEGYDSTANAPYGRLIWNLSTRTLSIFTYPDYVEIVVYRDGTWLSHQTFSLYLIGNITNSSTTDVQRFLTLYEWQRNSATVFNAMSDGYYFGLLDGYNSGYSYGYDIGFENGVETSQPFANIIGDVLAGLDKFVIFGDFSILDIIKAIMGIFLAVWLLKLFAGG